ncbi:hypothetical protein K456DRAFT_1749819 [Colletotrichum gloeosporioides 23]|nr:hypothetical protein K456DRAFT_1749819 [Colletotrichum gloeosporioides 23]
MSSLYAGSQRELLPTPQKHGHPRQWGKTRKMYDTCLIIFLEFFTYFGIRSMLTSNQAPISEHLHRESGLSSVAATASLVSTYLVGQAIGGVLYVISTILYSISCVVVGAMPTIPVIIVGRLVAGLLSSVPTVIAVGSIEDMWDTQARVWWVFTWALVANIAVLLCLIKESRPSVALAKIEASETGVRPNMREKLDLVRPLRLFFTEPIVFMVAILSAIAFGLIYLFTEVLPMVYLHLDFQHGWKNIPFLALGIGMVLSVFTRVYDSRLLAKKTAACLPITPESKCIGFVIGAPLLAGSLWLFAWTIPPQVVSVHWIFPTLALVPIGYAVNEFDHVLAGYLTDCYETYAASGFAALALTRSLCCATFPLFGRIMFDSLDFNIATTIFAGLATVICVVPPLMIKYGGWLRRRSLLAAK